MDTDILYIRISKNHLWYSWNTPLNFNLYTFAFDCYWFFDLNMASLLDPYKWLLLNWHLENSILIMHININPSLRISHFNINQISVAYFSSLQSGILTCILKLIKVRKKYSFYKMGQNKVFSYGNYHNISQRKHVWTFLNIE